MAKPITEYKDKVIEALLTGNYITSAFPEWKFRDRGNRWVTPLHVDGGTSHDTEQSYIYKNGNTLVDQNGDWIGIIDLYQREKSLDFFSAVKELGSLCGMGHLFPSSDNEEWKNYEETQKQRREAQAKFTSALWSGTQEANRVLAYLRSRGWADEEIKRGGLGYADEDSLSNLPFRDTHNETTGKTLTGLGTSHRLTIPYESGSSLYGFKFRDIDYSSKRQEAESRGGDYKGIKYLNTYGLSRNSGLFSIPVTCKDLVIVEGELDALHARVMGAKEVAATTGGRATEDQIKDALRRGVEKFTLLYDNDPSGKSFILPTLDAIEAKGAQAYVAYLPKGYKDTDEYLTEHSLQDWEKLVGEATPSYYYRLDLIRDKYIDLQNRQEGSLTMKQREDFFTEVEALLNSPSMIARPHNRQLVKDAIRAEEATLHFAMSDFEEWADRAYLRQQAKDRREAIVEAASKIQDLLKEGQTENALKLMRETASKQGAQDKATEFSQIFSPMRANAIDTYLSEIPEGIPTGITFKEGKQVEPLTLNPGLTFICAYRGHGKTTFLNNIALNEVKRLLHLQQTKPEEAQEAGDSVLYFSYEVDKRRLIADLLNTFVDDPTLSRRPLDSILSYFKGHKEFIASDHLDSFETRKREFFSDYLESGRLVIVEESYKVEKLLEAIAYYCAIHKPSLVCIDYAQLIYSEDYSRQRTEEIKKVVNDIKDFSRVMKIPFVMAAQFNREVYTPVSVDTRNIGEGGDFERIADTCIGLFNLKELRKSGNKTKDEEKEALKLLSRLTGETLTELAPMPGKIFARLLKRRYGYYPLDIILEWEGKTKKIKLNDEKGLLNGYRETLTDFEGIDLEDEEEDFI